MKIIQNLAYFVKLRSELMCVFLSLADIFQLHQQNQSSLNSVCCLALPLPVSSGEAKWELAMIQYLKALNDMKHRM